MKLRNTVTVVVAVAMAAMIQTAQATITDNLADLVATDGSLQIGDKTFSGFSYTPTDLSGFDAAKIIVTASIGSDGVYYLNWAGKINLTSSGPATADLLLGYTVTANPGVIIGIDQS